MTDKEKVFAGLECCMNTMMFDPCPHHCPYHAECLNLSYAPLLADCIKLLKEQEGPIKKFELERSWDENQTRWESGEVGMTKNDYFILGMLVGFALTVLGFILGALVA